MKMRTVPVLALLLALSWLNPLTAVASGATLTGFVTGPQGAAVGSADVTAAGNNRALHATTDALGRFAFADLPLGTYQVEAHSSAGTGRATVDLGSGGATVAILLSPAKEIARVTTIRSSNLRGSGADVSLNATDLSRAPYAGSIPEALIQLPGAVRGANGVVHMNGDHGVINYVIDGVPIPQALNRQLGSEINSNDVSFLDVIEGAYPAQYGLKFGDVLNFSTKAETGPAGYDAGVSAGSYADMVQTLNFHAPIAGGGGYSVGVRNERSNRGLDPPDFDSPHNQFSDTNQFARVTLPGRSAGSFTDVSFTHSFRTYQIPNDVQNGEPATTHDNETQNDAFLALQVHRRLNANDAISYGPAFKFSRIRDFGDPNNDFAFGEALNLGNGGGPTDCADAVATGNFGPTTCGFSLNADKTAIDKILQTDFVHEASRHEVRAGLSYDLTSVHKMYAATLQPDNFLSAAPFTVTDVSPNTANTYGSYIQDKWRISPLYEADYGLRYDFFTIRSTSFAQGFGAFSPRLKVTRFFGPRASIYAYIGRFFEPFSFENVDPHAAQLLNLPLEPSLAQFDLKPERDTQLEFGGHVPLGPGTFGFRVWQKNANDLIDDTQVGVTLLHQDINYSLGRLSQEAIDYTLPLARGGRAYVNIAHTLSLNKGCETQLLAPCFGSPDDFTPADHDQSYSVTSGVLLNGRGGSWFSGDMEYGSGLSSGICPADDTGGYCKRTPHTIFAVEQGVPLGDRAAVSLRVQNLFNDRYYVTILNAQGNHVAPPRTIDLTFSFKR